MREKGPRPKVVIYGADLLEEEKNVVSINSQAQTSLL
jgi:hypothetical protein